MRTSAQTANHHDLGLFGIGSEAPGPTRGQQVGLYHLAWAVGTIQELTEENAGQLADQLVKDFQRDKKTVVEPPKPIILGDTLFLRHVRRAKMASGNNVVVQSLETVQGGRIYVVELIAEIDAPRPEEYEQSLLKYRDDGYAVAAHLKFPGSEPVVAPPPAPTGESNPSDSPAE